MKRTPVALTGKRVQKPKRGVATANMEMFSSHFGTDFIAFV